MILWIVYKIWLEYTKTSAWYHIWAWHYWEHFTRYSFFYALTDTQIREILKRMEMNYSKVLSRKTLIITTSIPIKIFQENTDGKLKKRKVLTYITYLSLGGLFLSLNAGLGCPVREWVARTEAENNVLNNFLVAVL